MTHGKSEEFLKSRRDKGKATALDQKPELFVEDLGFWSAFNILLSGGVLFKDIILYCEVYGEADPIAYVDILLDLKMAYDKQRDKESKK